MTPSPPFLFTLEGGTYEIERNIFTEGVRLIVPDFKVIPARISWENLTVVEISSAGEIIECLSSISGTLASGDLTFLLGPPGNILSLVIIINRVWQGDKGSEALVYALAMKN